MTDILALLQTDEINEYLQEGYPNNSEKFTVEAIAKEIGISKKTLYKWVKTDREFSESLIRLKTVLDNDPFKTGTEEDTFVNSMMIALVLMETRERHYKSENQ